jgi:hypothetical protein
MCAGTGHLVDRILEVEVALFPVAQEEAVAASAVRLRLVHRRRLHLLLLLSGPFFS